LSREGLKGAFPTDFVHADRLTAASINSSIGIEKDFGPGEMIVSSNVPSED